jgi:hypothetical protein
MASAGGESSGEECGLQIDVGREDGRQSKPRGKGAKVTKAAEVSWMEAWGYRVGQGVRIQLLASQGSFGGSGGPPGRRCWIKLWYFIVYGMLTRVILAR